MLIKKVLNDYYHSRNSSRVKLIAIPNGFGKSTIVDMVKRFAEIVVDNDGNRIGLNETDNYRLFCKQSEPLKICREQSFVAEHMGRYPVVRIDYNQLRNVIDFESLLAAVRNLLSAVYSEHKYLLNVKRLWSQTFLFTRKTFHEYIDLRVRLPQSVIKNGFKLLTIILSVNFGKNTIVLIDEYDACYTNILYDRKLVNGSRDVVKFLRDINEGLLEYNEFLETALLTGVRSVDAIPLSIISKNVTLYQFRREKNETESSCDRYFGFTGAEVDWLLENNVRNVTLRNVIRKFLENRRNDDRYSISNNDGDNAKLYNMRTIIKLVRRVQNRT